MADAEDGRRRGLGEWPPWGQRPPELIDPGAPARLGPPPPPVPAEQAVPPQPAPHAPPVPGAGTSALSVAAIVVASLTGAFLLLVPILNCLGGALALVLGVAARREIYRAGGRLSGDGAAIGSIVVGGVMVVIGLLEIVVLFVIPFLLTR